MYRRFRLPSIWREMDQLQREMNRLMESSLAPRGFGPLSFPAINIWTSEEGQVITAEMPGFDPDDIAIQVTADKIILEGERKSDPIVEDAAYHRQERSQQRERRVHQRAFPGQGAPGAADRPGLLQLPRSGLRAAGVPRRAGSLGDGRARAPDVPGGLGARRRGCGNGAGRLTPA